MPCCVTDEEKSCYENREAKKNLERLNITYGDNVVSNAALCFYCSTLTLTELQNTGLEDWYKRHLLKDEPDRAISEILRIYG